MYLKGEKKDLDKTLLLSVAELSELEGLEMSWLMEEAEVVGRALEPVGEEHA